MTTVKHTPGPWVWNGKHGSLHRAGAQPYTYGELVLNPTWEYDAGVDVEISEADACVIKTAPDMLEALRPFASMALCTDHTDTRDGEIVMRLRNPNTGEWVVLKRDDFRAVLSVFAKATGASS